MKIKTSEATPLQLNWLVAVCEGEKLTILQNPAQVMVADIDADGIHWYAPTSNWSQAGTIIERERIDLFTEKGTPESWVASVARYQNGTKLVGWRIHQYGPTPLIAAMRCYCASKLGDEVDVPDELLGD